MSSDVEYGDRLACGTAVAHLVDQVADRLPPPDVEHQQDCLHCRAMLDELGEIWLAVHRLATEPVTVPPQFTKQVRRRILQPVLPSGDPASAPRPRGWVPLQSDGRGETRVGATTLARLVRLAARSVPGVTVPPVRRYHKGVEVTMADDKVRVGLEVRVPYGDDLVAVAEAVRMAVTVQLLAVAGLEDVRVDVNITGFTSD